MLLSYFFPSHLRSKKPEDYTWIETLVSYPATISEIDVAVGTLFASIVASSIITYYRLEDTFIGGPSTKFGFFKTVALYTAISMGLQWKNEKKLPPRKLDVSRTRFISFEAVLEAQSKLDQNLLSISSTNTKIEAIDKEKKEGEPIVEQQNQLQRVNTWLKNHEDDPDRLEDIQKYVNFAKEQASLSAEIHKIEVFIQTLQAEIDRLRQDCTPDNVEIYKCEIRKTELKKENDEIRRKGDGKLAKANKKVTEAQGVYNGIEKEYNEKQDRVTQNKLKLKGITDEIKEKSQREYTPLNRDSMQPLISEAKSNLKSYEHLHNQINLRLSELKNATLGTDNKKIALEKEIEELQKQLETLEITSEEQKEERKKSYLEGLKEKQEKLEAEKTKLIDQIKTDQANRKALSNVPVIKQSIEDLKKEISENLQKIKELAPDKPGTVYGTTDGVEVLNKKKEKHRKKYDDAKNKLETLEHIQTAISQELTKRKKTQDHLEKTISELNTEQSENTQSLTKIDFPDGNEIINKESIIQTPEDSIETILSSASTKLLNSILVKPNEPTKNRTVKNEEDYIQEAISKELKKREEQKRPLKEREEENKILQKKYETALSNIDNSQQYSGSKVPSPDKLDQLKPPKIQSMTTSDLQETLNLMTTPLATARADNKSIQDTYNATEQTCAEIEGLKAKNKDLDDQVKSHEETLKKDGEPYQTLTNKIDQARIKKNNTVEKLEKIQTQLEKPINIENNNNEPSDLTSVSKSHVQYQLKLKQDELEKFGASPPKKETTHSQTLQNISWLTLSPHQQALTINSCDAHTLEIEMQKVLDELIKVQKAIVEYEAKEQAQKDERERLAKEQSAAESATKELKLQEDPLKTLLEISERELAIEEKRIVEARIILANAQASVQFLNDRLKDLENRFNQENQDIKDIKEKKLQTRETTIDEKDKELKLHRNRRQELLLQIGKKEPERHKFKEALDAAIKHLEEHDEIKRYDDILKMAKTIRDYYLSEQAQYKVLEEASRKGTMVNIAIDLTSERSHIKIMEDFLKKYEERNLEPIREAIDKKKEEEDRLTKKIKVKNGHLDEQRSTLSSDLEKYNGQTSGLEDALRKRKIDFDKDLEGKIDLSQILKDNDFEKGQASTNDAHGKSPHIAWAQISSIATAALFMFSPDALCSLSGTNRVIVWLFCTVIQQASHESLDRYIKRNFE